MHNYRLSRIAWLLVGAAAMVGCSSFGDLLNPSFQANLGFSSLNPSSASQVQPMASTMTLVFRNTCTQTQSRVRFYVVYQPILNSADPQGHFNLSLTPASVTSPALQLIETYWLEPNESRTIVLECPSVFNLGQDASPFTSAGGTGLPTGNVMDYDSAGALGSETYATYGGANLLQFRDFQCGQVVTFTAADDTGTPAVTCNGASKDIPAAADYFPPNF